MNPRLRLAIQAARAENMPKDNIERAIKKALGGDADTYEAIRYEGYAPGGVAVIAEALTDNRNRTGGAVRAVFTKYGGNLGATGSVAHMFTHVGEITYPASAGSADAVLEAAIEAGADDVHSDADGHVITCAFDSLGTVAGALEEKLGEARSVKAVWKPNLTTQVDEENARDDHEDDRRARGRRRRAERLRQLRDLRRGPEEADGGLSAVQSRARSGSRSQKIAALEIAADGERGGRGVDLPVLDGAGDGQILEREEAGDVVGVAFS